MDLCWQSNVETSLFNMISRLLITFLPRSKGLLISWLQSTSAVILEPQNIKSDTVSPSISHWSDAPGPISSWQMDGKTMETVRDFILGGSKITVDSDCSHEIKRNLLLGRNVVTNLDSILKNRDLTLPTKVHLVKAMVFLVVMYRHESWTIKKGECRRIDAFELRCWRRLLRLLGLQGDPTNPS